MAAMNGKTTSQPNGDFPPDLLLCPVCEKPYREPKMLPCLHSFCQQCLQDSLSKSNISPGQAFLCPLCRTEITVPKRGVSAMQGNVFLETLAEFQDRKTGNFKAPKKKDVPKKCDGCDTRAPASMKCIECDDWLCSRCCNMHYKVKVTREHHLVTAGDLQSGAYDDVLKDTFQPLICSKHEEPLKLYCTEQTCLTPICTVCKNTLGHDGHHAVYLSDQAKMDTNNLQGLSDNVEKSISRLYMKINNIKQEERITSNVRKNIHKEINDRMALMVEKVVKQIGEYAESLHEEVERMAKAHKNDLVNAAEECKYQSKAMTDAQQFVISLTEFGRSEEIVAMSRVVSLRLNEFQVPPETDAPSWRHPRLHPPEPFTSEEIAKMFGHLTFEGEVVKSLELFSFTVAVNGDERPPAISDMDLTDDDEVIICDRDNRRVKIFDINGALQYATDDGLFKTPNRVTNVRPSGNVLVKDDKTIMILRPDGVVTSQFAPHLQHPVGSCQAPTGEIVLTDWATGTVHTIAESGDEIRSFSTSLEAPAYMAASLQGHIVISDWKNHVVRMFNRNGKVVAQYGGNGDGALPGQLNHPYGVTTDKFGHIIVADNWNHRVTLLEEDGRFIRHLVTKDDGIEWPQQVAVDSKGHLVVAELGGTIKLFQYLA